MAHKSIKGVHMKPSRARSLSLLVLRDLAGSMILNLGTLTNMFPCTQNPRTVSPSRPGQNDAVYRKCALMRPSREGPFFVQVMPRNVSGLYFRIWEREYLVRRFSVRKYLPCCR